MSRSRYSHFFFFLQWCLTRKGMIKKYEMTALGGVGGLRLDDLLFSRFDSVLGFTWGLHTHLKHYNTHQPLTGSQCGGVKSEFNPCVSRKNASRSPKNKQMKAAESIFFWHVCQKFVYKMIVNRSYFPWQLLILFRLLTEKVYGAKSCWLATTALYFCDVLVIPDVSIPLYYWLVSYDVFLQAQVMTQQKY